MRVHQREFFSVIHSLGHTNKSSEEGFLHKPKEGIHHTVWLAKNGGGYYDGDIKVIEPNGPEFLISNRHKHLLTKKAKK